jgi:gas vesicle protein
MVGLVEAILYAIRLHDLNYRMTTEVLAEKSKKSSEIADVIKKSSSQHENLIRIYHEIENTLSSGYSSDILMRSIPDWVTALVASSEGVQPLMETFQKHASDSLPISDGCPKARGPGIVEIVNSFPKLAKGPSRTISATTTLSNGKIMPLIGLGTWQLEGEVCERTVIEAIRLGYRHIDTAEAYRNEADVGWGIYHAIYDGLVTREDLFVATKISDESNGGYENTKNLVERQLQDLRLDYIDLYMLHSPMRDKSKQMDTWKALEELVDEGKIRSLGIR